jgi:1-acyl-sn-glycerol-3-phosphate acyltransferase
LFYWFLKRIVLGPILRLIFRPYVIGAENVPAEGGAIFASNHLSFSDSIFLPLVVERRITFLAKADYFTGAGFKGWLTAKFFRGVGQLPVDRSGGSASEAALRTGLRILRRGECLGIYPEGTRSPDGRLYRGKTGVARMALEAEVPVLPVAMIDTEKIQPPGRKRPTLGIRVGIKIGAPLDFSRYEGMEGDRFVLRSITDEIMYELMELSGQEYVDIYAQVAKDQIKAERAAQREEARAAKAAEAAAKAADAASDESGSAADPAEPAPPATPRPADPPAA